MISKIDSIIESVKARVKDNFDNYGIKDYYLDFKIYGKNGVMSCLLYTSDAADE